MGNWAGQPQTQALERQTEYSRFARAGNRVLGLLLAAMLATMAHANEHDSGESILAPSSENGTIEATPEATPDESIIDDGSALEEGAAPVAPAPEVTAKSESPSDSPAADAPELNQNVPLRYVVKKGDTLWDIADYYLKEPWKWPELWYGNPNIKNPHLIYPGDVLYLTYVDGRPRLSHEPPPSPAGVEKLSPRVRETPLEDAIPTIPGDAIRAFLRGPRVVGAAELDAAPYIVDFADEHLVGGAGVLAYAKGLDEGAVPNHSLLRKGDVYRDPESKEILGYEATYVGTTSVRTPGSPARVSIDTTVREVLVGDRLLPQDENDLLDSAYFPHAPESEIEGYIIAATGSVMNVGQYQIVTLSKGTKDGVEVGHVFAIHQTGRRVEDPHGSANATVTLPEEEAGLLLVFKTYERVSYALVMKSFRSVHLLDKFRTPED